MATTKTMGVQVSPDPINKWWYVVSCFVALMVGVNTVNILFNVLGSALTAGFGWSRLELVSGLTLFTVVDGISVLLIGFLVSRYGIRKVAIPAAAMFGLGIGLIGLSPNDLRFFYACCAISGVGAGAVGPSVYSVVVGAWFDDKRGLALGIINVGLGLCGTLMPFLINGLFGAYGWRWTFAVVGLLCGLIPVVAYGAVLRMPRAWDTARVTARSSGKGIGEPLGALLKQRSLWLISISILLVSAATYGMLSQIVAICTDHHIARVTALSILSTASISSIASRLVVGYLLDRLFAPFLACSIFLLCAAGVVVLTQTAQVPVLYGGAVLLGLGLGAEGDIAAYIISRYIDKNSYAKALGIVIFLFAQGGALGVGLLSYTYSITSSYTVAGALIFVLTVLSAFSLLFLGPYRYDVTGAKVTSHHPALPHNNPLGDH
ncbi:MFS transporter [Pseudomonas typographi]|uniref:MFS transporter n=1 Tax=Pseudomonas typographi TaxID=2715964 RepID=A0ABR7Z4X3_9PSED|nr:MFS transporter [Pseudomonas typographi]MBD1600550.1 MFS transporter [Pseudomonas typographi]